MVDANVRSADPRNYQLPGRVSLWFRTNGSSLDADWKELGNIIDPTFAPQIERLDHFSQRRGQRAKDRSEISQRGGTISFSIDEINLHNLQFAFGSAAAPVDDSVDLLESKVLTNPGGSAPDNTIDLAEIDIEVGSVIVRSSVLEDEVTYATPADYTVDEATGIITIAPGGALNSADPDTGVPEIHVFWRKNVETQKFEIFDGTEIEGEAQFQVLTKGGMQYAIKCARVVIRNNGDITIGDGQTWQQIALQMDILEDANGQLGNMHQIYTGELEA